MPQNINLVKIRNRNLIHTQTEHYFTTIFMLRLQKKVNFLQKTSQYTIDNYHILTRLAQ